MGSGTVDLVLKPSCERCGSSSDLYGSGCKHTTLCLPCGKAMALARALCNVCAAPIVKLIREYNVRAGTAVDKSFYIGRFVTGLPPFSKKKSAENRWSLHKDGPQGRQLTDNMREKYNKRPWVLEDETGQHQYQGQLEGSQSSNATYYLLMLQGKEFLAFPTSSMYNFSKIAQYKQLTLEEAEEKMNKRRHNATGYERWMMKAAASGAATFGGDAKKIEAAETAGAQTGRPKKVKNEDGDHSDKDVEDEEEEAARRNRLGLNKKGMDDEEDGGPSHDIDLDDDDVEKGDDWEHEEIFTDDDEAVGNDPLDQEDLAPDIPAPPEIKQDDDDEEGEEESGLSKSGKELKKLLGKNAGLNDSEAEEDDDDDEEDENGISPVLAPKQKEILKDEPVESSPAKPTPGGQSKPASGSKTSKSKRKAGAEDGKPASSVNSAKKLKAETDPKHIGVKDDITPSKAPTPTKVAPPHTSRVGTSSELVTEEEIRAALLSSAPVTTQDLVSRFRPRLKSKEDKDRFAEILRKISKIQKTNGNSFIVLR